MVGVRVSVLKQYEVYCYSVAYFLLEKEETALLAAINTLLELSEDDLFFLESDEISRRKKVKSLSIKNSLKIKRKSIN